MPLVYESAEFVEELKKRINTNSEYREKVKGASWKTLVIIKDVPFAVYSNYVDGELVERKHLPPSGVEEVRKDVDFAVEVPTYDLMIEAATGKKSLQTLFLTGAVKFEGSIFKALHCRSAIEASENVTAALVKESIIPSKEDFVKMLHERGLL